MSGNQLTFLDSKKKRKYCGMDIFPNLELVKPESKMKIMKHCGQRKIWGGLTFQNQSIRMCAKD
jgi:hypothetical protein